MPRATDPAILEQAATLPGSPDEVAAQLGVSERTVYRARAARGPANAKKTTPHAEPPRYLPPEPVPAHLTGTAAHRWIIAREIEATRGALAASRVPGSPLFGRTAALQEQLRRLMQDERELTPPAPHDPGDEDRQWRAQGEDVIRRIEAGVRAVEERIARERGAAS